MSSYGELINKYIRKLYNLAIKYNFDNEYFNKLRAADFKKRVVYISLYFPKSEEDIIKEIEERCPKEVEKRDKRKLIDYIYTLRLIVNELLED